MNKQELENILGNINFEVETEQEWLEPLGFDRDTWKQILNYIFNLQEEIKWYEKENKHNQEIIVKDINILTELEKWLNKQLEDSLKCLEFNVKNNNKTFVDMYSRDRRLYKMNVDKIQELKEKYK